MPDEAGITASELSEIIDSASSHFLPEDSGEEQPEAEEGAEEADEEGSQEESDDESTEDDEDPEESEEDDEDSLEDDEEDESDDEDEEDEEESPEGVLDLADDSAVKLSDGTELTGRELREGYLRQRDYTVKTQKVADTYRKMEQWYEQRVGNPQGWIAEIAYSSEDPASAIAGAIRETGNATVLLGQTLRHLVESGEIADELVEALNLTSVAEQAKEQSVHEEVKSLRADLQNRDFQAAEQVEMARVEQELNRQWDTVVTQNNLDFGNESDKFSAKVQLLEFARDRGIPDLEAAYAAMTYLTGNQAAPQNKKQTPKKRKQAESAVKKRKTAAVSRKPTGGGRTGKPSTNGDVVGNAAEQALEELGLDL